MVTVCRYMYWSRSVSVSVSRWGHQFRQAGGWILGDANRGARHGAKSANVRMKPMAKTLGGFRATVLIGWMALSVAGVLYARLKGIPSWAAVPVLAAFLVEFPFYLVPAFPTLRERLAGARLPWFLLASTVLPYWCAAAARSVSMDRPGASDGALAGALPVVRGAAGHRPHGYRLPGVDRLRDAGPVLRFHLSQALPRRGCHLSREVGVDPDDRHDPDAGAPHTRDRLRLHPEVERVAHRRAPLFCISFRSGSPWLWPSRRSTGPRPSPFWVVAGTFLGMLWVVVLFEEFLFRGVLQQWIEEWTGAPQPRFS